MKVKENTLPKGKFSIVVALYGVEDYVETFFRSLEKQTYGIENLDIVVVDDGSIDNSYNIVKRWADRYPRAIRHTTKSNGGPASARNVGIELAQNEWVTFADPDDAFQPTYFEKMQEFLERDTYSQAIMLAGRPIIWHDESGKLTDSHPLGRKFRFGDRLVDLNLEPNNIQLTGVTAFMLREVLIEHGLRFDTRVVPTFEDAHLIGRYLATFQKPVIGLVSMAKYMYRKRSTGGSLVQSSWSKLERYDDVIRHGYLGLLEVLTEKTGVTPVWAQNMVLYDLQWYFSEDKKMHSATGKLTASQLMVFHDLLNRTFAYIDRASIDNYNTTPLAWATREAMLARYKGHGLKPHRVGKWSRPGVQPVQLVYTYVGRQPVETFEIDGLPVQPITAKSVNHRYFGEEFFVERDIFLPKEGAISVRLNGVHVPFGRVRRPGWAKPLEPTHPLVLKPVSPSRIRHFTFAAKVENRIGIERLVSGTGSIYAARNVVRRVVRRRIQAKRVARDSRSDQLIYEWATSRDKAALYSHAWVIMDRVTHADDNGEHLYRYILKTRPEINAWFLLDPESKDWNRLESEGFRLIAYGSNESIALLLNADYQISSDATYEVQYPIGRERFGTPRAKIVFLQHGITMHDLSRWLNPKDIYLMMTATQDEYASIAGDVSPYRYTKRQVALTGFPRFDSLVRKMKAIGVDGRKYLLVMPTWRQSLVSGIAAAATDFERAQVLVESKYGREWLGFLESSTLKDTANTHNLEILFVPHPALIPFVHLLNLPPHVKIHSDPNVSLQDIFVRTRIGITDYSSIAFDLAFIGIPVLYFQFDSETLYDGSHNYRRGYYDYSRDGFGPVCETRSQLQSSVDEIADGGFVVGESFQQRVGRTFAYVDDKNSERVVNAILESEGERTVFGS